MLNTKIFIPNKNVVIWGYNVRMEEVFGIPPVQMTFSIEGQGSRKEIHKENSGFITTFFAFSH